jgi:hypothetical protein
MAITIQQFDGPPVFIVSRVCLSMPEARAAEAALSAMPEASAYLPHHAEQAAADGVPATGGGASSQSMLGAGEFEAGELAPDKAALAELQADDPPFNGPDFPGEAAPQTGEAK